MTLQPDQDSSIRRHSFNHILVFCCTREVRRLCTASGVVIVHIVACSRTSHYTIAHFQQHTISIHAYIHTHTHMLTKVHILAVSTSSSLEGFGYSPAFQNIVPTKGVHLFPPLSFADDFFHLRGRHEDDAVLIGQNDVPRADRNGGKRWLV